MLSFLANNIEQVDLALEHVTKRTANDARFGVMLLDNVVEITLHQIAKDKRGKRGSLLYRDKPDEHSPTLQAALGQHFESKVKFAKKIGKLSDEVSESIGIFHSFRNEIYHIGVQHEAVLPVIAAFYFKVACEFLGGYSPPWIGYSPDMELPERARKFFAGRGFYINCAEQYQEACKNLGDSLTFVPAEMACVLADHVDSVIKMQDIGIRMLATAGPRKHTRDEAVAETFAWTVAVSDEGKRFARERGFNEGSMLDYITWLAKNYPLPLGKDPIPGWKSRAAGIRAERNPHKALKKYRDFMTQTADARAAIEQAHGQVEQYVEEQIERMRMRRK